MRSFLTNLIVIALLAATGCLFAEVIFGVSTPFGIPSLLLVTTVLIVLALQLRKNQRRRLLYAIDTYLQRESLKELEVKLQREREKTASRKASDSQPVQQILS